MTAGAPCRVRVFSRPDCCLCDEVLHHLDALRRRFTFDVTTVNVDDDDALRVRHGERVPVVEINGKEIGWGRVPPEIMEQHLVRAARRS